MAREGTPFVNFWKYGGLYIVRAKLPMGLVLKYGLCCAKDARYTREVEQFVLNQQEKWGSHYSLTPYQRSTKKNIAVRAELEGDERQARRLWEFNRMALSYDELIIFAVVCDYLKKQEEKELEVPKENNEEVGVGEGVVVPLSGDGVCKNVDQDSKKEVR